jgi:hypothetical protein
MVSTGATVSSASDDSTVKTHSATPVCTVHARWPIRLKRRKGGDSTAEFCDCISYYISEEFNAIIDFHKNLRCHSIPLEVIRKTKTSSSSVWSKHLRWLRINYLSFCSWLFAYMNAY